MDYKRSLYNIGLNGNGYLLTNIARKRPRIMSQSSVFGTRFAQGDRSYLDFNLWWYWAQSEWSNGLKDTLSWADDGKYYFSSNIDAFSKVGSLQLMKTVQLQLTTNANYLYENITCGISTTQPLLTGYVNNFVGTNKAVSGVPSLYYYNTNTTSWVNPTTAMTSSLQAVSQIINRGTQIWLLATSSSFNLDELVSTFNIADASYKKHNAYIDNTSGFGQQFSAMTCGLAYGANIYLAGISGNYGYSVVYSSIDYPYSGEASSSWHVLFQIPSYSGAIVDMCAFNGAIYYLVSYETIAELYLYDFTSSTSILIHSFSNCNIPTAITNLNASWGGRLLFSQNGNLVVTIPDNEIYTVDTNGKVSRVYLKDPYKILLGYDAIGYLGKGGVMCNNNIYWGNLMYDGTNIFNSFKVYDLEFFYPLFSDTNNFLWGLETDLQMSSGSPVNPLNMNKLYQNNTTYGGVTGKNFLVFSQNDVISTIDKIFHHATFNFNYLATGESIIIEYLLSDLTPTSNAAWTSLGSATFANDGATINTKTIYFPDNTVGKKMWLRVKLESSNGTTTPTFNDIAIAYLPMPDLKHDWTLYLECYDNMMLLDGKTKETKRGEELKSLLKFNWWSKTAMDFQDVDYAETLLNGAITDPTSATITVDSTLDFPQQGRLRIEQEEILYTGKGATTFTGCTRGARGSLATTHSDNTLVATNYKVIIQSLEEFTPELQNIKVKNEESVVVLSLREL
jgi:hypothetical protein